MARQLAGVAALVRIAELQRAAFADDAPTEPFPQASHTGR